MSSYTQNLFLFFEESVHQPDVSSNIVRIAMNKFIVDEDAQFEVVGVFYLKRRIQPLDVFQLISKTDREKFLEKVKEKYKHDLRVIYKALKLADSISSEIVDTHFIIGSRFHAANCLLIGDHRNRIPFVCHRISQVIEGTCLQSLQCTVFDGVRDNLINRQMSMDLFSSKLTTADLTINDLDENFRPKSSVYDDVENLIQEIKNNKRPTKDWVLSYLHSSLTESESLQLEQNETQFWEKFPSGARNRSCLPTLGCFGDSRALNDKSETKFVNIRCKRFTSMQQLHKEENDLHVYYDDLATIMFSKIFFYNKWKNLYNKVVQ